MNFLLASQPSLIAGLLMPVLSAAQAVACLDAARFCDYFKSAIFRPTHFCSDWESWLSFTSPFSVDASLSRSLPDHRRDCNHRRRACATDCARRGNFKSVCHTGSSQPIRSSHSWFSLFHLVSCFGVL